MSLGFSNNTDCAFAEILVQSLPTENRRKLEESFLLPVSQNNAYGHKLVVFCSCCLILCVHCSSHVLIFLLFPFMVFLYRVEVAFWFYVITVID